MRNAGPPERAQTSLFYPIPYSMARPNSETNSQGPDEGAKNPSGLKHRSAGLLSKPLENFFTIPTFKKTPIKSLHKYAKPPGDFQALNRPVALMLRPALSSYPSFVVVNGATAS